MSLDKISIVKNARGITLALVITQFLNAFIFLFKTDDKAHIIKATAVLYLFMVFMIKYRPNVGRALYTVLFVVGLIIDIALSDSGILYQGVGRLELYSFFFGPVISLTVVVLLYLVNPEVEPITEKIEEARPPIKLKPGERIIAFESMDGPLAIVTTKKNGYGVGDKVYLKGVPVINQKIKTGGGFINVVDNRITEIK